MSENVGKCRKINLEILKSKDFFEKMTKSKIFFSKILCVLVLILKAFSGNFEVKSTYSDIIRHSTRSENVGMRRIMSDNVGKCQEMSENVEVACGGGDLMKKYPQNFPQKFNKNENPRKVSKYP